MKVATLILAMTLGGWAYAKQSLTPEGQAKVNAYKEKLSHKSLENLLAETGINLGVTASQCGTSTAERIVRSVKESTDAEELRKAWESTETKNLCREASAKLAVSAEALKKKSKTAWRAFLAAAEGN